MCLLCLYCIVQHFWCYCGGIRVMLETGLVMVWIGLRVSKGPFTQKVFFHFNALLFFNVNRNMTDVHAH